MLLLFAGIKYYGLISDDENGSANATENVVTVPLEEETAVPEEAIEEEEVGAEELENEGDEVDSDLVGLDEGNVGANEGILEN